MRDLIPSIWDRRVQETIDQARDHARRGHESLVRLTIRAADGAAKEDHVAIPTPFPSPQDWRDQWIYFLLVDRFNNPNAPPQDEQQQVRPWDTPYDGFLGGTLDGVRQRLPYLQSLGVGAIWLSPVLRNLPYPYVDKNGVVTYPYHGYAIQNYLTVDPRFASPGADPEAELRALVDEAHARGMYVILDVVLNHSGDVFAYEPLPPGYSIQPWRGEPDEPYGIFWRTEQGHPNHAWADAPVTPPFDAAVWPTELRHNDLYRRRGSTFTEDRGGRPDRRGDFYALKELRTDYCVPGTSYYPVRDALIRIHQYLIARFDVDGFRLDATKQIDRVEIDRMGTHAEFAKGIHEFALSIGKRNFFIAAEIKGTEEEIAGFFDGDPSGLDAAFDFPLFETLSRSAKALPYDKSVAGMFATRKAIQQHTISSHGDATRFFVTFLDNHDEKARFFCRPAPDPANPGAIHRFDDQLTLGMACLFTLQGIPCIYYGTEQGLHGAGDVDEAVREALWGKPDVFQFDWHADYAAAPVDSDHKFYFELREIARVRRQQPALKYGRQYFRQVSPVDDGSLFQVPQQAGSVLAFSRILQDEEVLVVANTNTEHPWSGDVVVDFSLNPIGAQYQLLYSNCRRYGRGAAAPGRVVERRRGTVTILEDTKPPTTGPIRVVRVTLQSMEVQIMSR